MLSSPLPPLPPVVHCCTLLYTVAHCCTLLHIVAHCCTLLHIVAHCIHCCALYTLYTYLRPGGLGSTWLANRIKERVARCMNVWSRKEACRNVVCKPVKKRNAANVLAPPPAPPLFSSTNRAHSSKLEKPPASRVSLALFCSWV